jgi:ribosomal protein L37AE/L43A
MIIGIRGEKGMLCPKCKIDMIDITPLMMLGNWQCQKCARRYSVLNYETNEMRETPRVTI